MSSSYIDPEYEYHEFYLDSKDATKTIDSTVSSLNQPLFQLPTALKDIVSFKVLEAQIPMSYSITAGVSFILKYYGQYPGGGTIPNPLTKMVTLPTTGTLSGAQIASNISDQILNFPPNTAGWEKTGGSDSYLVCTFVPASSSATGLPYFEFKPNDHALTSGTNVQEDFAITISDQQSADLMGFPEGTTRCTYFGYSPDALIALGLPGISGTYLKPLKSVRPTLITGAPYIYVTSNTIGNLCKTYLPLGASLLGGGVSNPQMAKIPVSNVVQGQWLVWQDSNPAWFDVDNIATLSQLDLYLQLGNYGGYIDFQGLSFSLKLGVLVKRSAKIVNNGRGTFIQSTPFFSNR